MALPSVNPEGRGRRSAAALAAGAVVLAASRLGFCLRAFPCLGVLRGPLGVLLAVVTAAVALAPWLPSRPVARPAPPLALLLLAWVLLSVVGLSYTLRLRVSGDEPHYLLMAQSLWR